MINMLTINRDEQFIDREEELSFLEESYHKQKFTFIVVYRRRMGGKASSRRSS